MTDGDATGRSDHDNDADKRPMMYGKAQTRDGSVEVSVTGSEGEGTEDLTDAFDHALDRITSQTDGLDDDSSQGVE